MYFIVTVDTEADNQWARKENISLENLKSLPRFQRLAEEYSFRPTYLITYEVAENLEAMRLLSDWQNSGQAEIGAHLHPWTNPPYEKDIAWERQVHRFPSELSDKELESKLGALTEKITKNLGQAPVSYRAGRWGFDTRQVRMLEKLGYLADCSITPLVSWAATKGDPTGSGGPDFRAAPISPYYLDYESVIHSGGSKILEVPLTVLKVFFRKKMRSR